MPNCQAPTDLFRRGAGQSPAEPEKSVPESPWERPGSIPLAAIFALDHPWAGPNRITLIGRRLIGDDPEKTREQAPTQTRNEQQKAKEVGNEAR